MRKLIYIITVIIILNSIFISAMDISINIPEKYEKVEVGEKLYFTFEVKDPENIGRHDISLRYEIKKGNKTITTKTETIGIGTQTSFVKTISIPKNIESGLYLIIVEVNNKKSASAIFYVENLKEKQINYFLIIIISIITFGSLIWLELYRIRKTIKK